MREQFEKYKYLILVLFIGIILISLPTSSDTAACSGATYASEEETRLEEVLSKIDGVGETAVLYSAEGITIVCEGAEKSSVKLNIINAVTAYTGYAVNKISVVKMKLA